MGRIQDWYHTRQAQQYSQEHRRMQQRVNKYRGASVRACAEDKASACAINNRCNVSANTMCSASSINRSSVSANTVGSISNERSSEGDINQDRRIEERSKKTSSAGVHHHGYYKDNHRGEQLCRRTL
jgi:hypothetical protein